MVKKKENTQRESEQKRETHKPDLQYHQLWAVSPVADFRGGIELVGLVQLL